MTENQRKYLEYQENQRHNLAMEEVNANKVQEDVRANLAKEAEQNRSNLAREAETKRANNWDNFYRGVENVIKGVGMAQKAKADMVDAMMPDSFLF